MTFHLLMAVSIAIISQFLVGFNTSVLNAPAAVVFPGHSTLSWSLAVSAFAIGGPIGSIFGGLAANRYGRKGTIMINTLVFLMGGIMMTLAPSVVWLVFARFIIGLSSGIAMVVVPVYLGKN
jgi:SP family facilitated glucose transporter-like MFS transporter 3